MIYLMNSAVLDELAAIKATEALLGIDRKRGVRKPQATAHYGYEARNGQYVHL